MRRRWIGLAAGAAMIASGAVARADDSGCCEIECRESDGSGAQLRSLQRREMTQADCEKGFPDCNVSWRPQDCAVGGEVGIVRQPDDE